MRVILFIFIVFLEYPVLGQGFRSKFQATGCHNHYSKAIYETTPGNYFSAGIAVDTSSGSNIICLIVCGLNSTGAKTWEKKYGDPNCQYPFSTFISRSFFKEGNYIYYTGPVKDTGQYYKGTLIKFDLNGDIVWQEFYKDSTRDVVPQMVTRSVDGGFLLTGFYQDWNLHENPALLIKTDSSGKELWRRIINKITPNFQEGRGIAQDSATKRIAVVGYQLKGTNQDVTDNFLILDSLGNTIYQSFHVLGVLQDLIRTRDGKFIAVGLNRTPMGSGIYKNYSYIFKFDINSPSAPIWKLDKFDVFTYENQFNCLTEMPDGDVLVAGQFDSLLIQNQKTNIWTRITRIDPNGVIRSNRYYDYASPNYEINLHKMTSIELTSDGGWVGAIAISNSLSDPFFFVKYDSTGCDSTIEYCLNPTGLSDKIGVSHLSVFPNPASETLNITTDEGLNNTNYSVYNSLGKIILKGVLGFENNTASLNTRELAPGVYYLQLNNYS
jgi:hypothetical protein